MIVCTGLCYLVSDTVIWSWKQGCLAPACLALIQSTLTLLPCFLLYWLEVFMVFRNECIAKGWHSWWVPTVKGLGNVSELAVCSHILHTLLLCPFFIDLSLLNVLFLHIWVCLGSKVICVWWLRWLLTCDDPYSRGWYSTLSLDSFYNTILVQFAYTIHPSRGQREQVVLLSKSISQL